MGIDISGIVEGETKTLKDFNGKTIAIDSNNALYQFLSSIRERDGSLLQDSQGRVTSHLAGLLYRTINFLETGINPVYVFDGKPHPLKKSTLETRRSIREKAAEEWQRALEEGDIERAQIKAKQSSKLTPEMIEETKLLLEYLGIPYVVGASDGEAQASYMTIKGDVWATASQDFDSLLFGAPCLIRNLAITGKRKLPKRRVYVEIEPELIVLENILKKLGISREQLIDIGIMIGTDFNEGIHGIGAKKALKYIKEYKTLENIMKEKNFYIPGYEEIRNIFLEPEITSDYRVSWKQPDFKKVKEFLCEEHDFSPNRVTNALDKLATITESRTQKRLDQWF